MISTGDCPQQIPQESSGTTLEIIILQSYLEGVRLRRNIQLVVFRKGQLFDEGSMLTVNRRSHVTWGLGALVGSGEFGKAPTSLTIIYPSSTWFFH